MPTQILMPALSPTMDQGTLAKWLVKEGDRVSSGDVIAEIETDKATMEFEAVEEGVIGRILVPEGAEAVKVNAPIAELLEDGEDAGALPEAAATAPPAAESAPAATAPPPAAGAPAAPPAPSDTPSDTGGARIRSSPLARRLAAEHGIDLAAVAGSGPRGRVVKADVEAAAAAPRPAAAETPASAPASTDAKAPAGAAAAPAPAPAGPTSAGPSPEAVLRLYEGVAHEEVALDGMRRTVAARLTEAKQTVPHFYLRRDARLDRLLEFRAELNGRLAARGVKISVNDFVVKALALALQEVPEANAVWAGDRILRFRASDVAVAVAVEGGLFTPVLRGAEAKTLSALSTEMKDLAERARAKRLSPAEYQGGSTAVSNLGMFGIESFDAVINPPHGSILAVGAGVRRPVVAADGGIEAATMMTLTLSVDHRVIDGALGARLLGAAVDLLEDPVAMLA